MDLGELVNLEQKFERRHFSRSAQDAEQDALRCERLRGNYKFLLTDVGTE